MAIKRASAKLLAAVARRRTVVIAQPHSEELRFLDYFGAEASVNSTADGARNGSILLRPKPSKAAVLEEFLHGTQARLGIIDRLGVDGSEAHVKTFMIRHRRLLGLGAEDVDVIRALLDRGL